MDPEEDTPASSSFYDAAEIERALKEIGINDGDRFAIHAALLTIAEERNRRAQADGASSIEQLRERRQHGTRSN